MRWEVSVEENVNVLHDLEYQKLVIRLAPVDLLLSWKIPRTFSRLAKQYWNTRGYLRACQRMRIEALEAMIFDLPCGAC